MKEAGFTLVEVLVALLIFSFAIIGLTRSGTESVRAVGVLQDKSLYRAQPFARIECCESACP